MNKNYIVMFLLTSLLLGCQSVDVTENMKFSNLVGVCKKTTKEHLFTYDKMLENYYLSQLGNPYFLKYPEYAYGLVSKGTKFQVQSIIHESYGEAGYAWRVKIIILDGEFAGKVSDIPTRVSDSSPTWINLKRMSQSPTEELKIKKEFAVDC